MTLSKSTLRTWGVLFILFNATFSLVRAQDSTHVGIWAFAGMEMNSYSGDLSSYNQFNSAFSGGIRFNRNERFNGQITLTIGKIKAENTRLDIPPSAQAPNNFFSTSVIEVYYQLNYHFIKTRHWLVYVGQGAGFLQFNPKDQFGESLSDQPATRAGNESYRSLTFLFPTKFGATYLLDSGFGAGIEAGFHNPITDYLDNVSELGTGGFDNILGIRAHLLVPIQHY